MGDPSLAVWMFPALFALVLAGVPVGFALIATAAAFGWPFFEDLLPRQMYGRLTELASGFAFAAVPAFIFMGAVLERAGIAERLFEAMRIWLGRLPGGLAIAAIAMAAVFAATTGIIGAVEIVIGMMAMPAMLKAGYDNRLVAGTITAGGSLGTGAWLIAHAFELDGWWLFAVAWLAGTLGYAALHDLLLRILSRKFGGR